MASKTRHLDVLMSIHPRFADQIMSGEKTVEFRRKTPKQSVERLIVYCTAPVQRVIGYARIVAIVEASIESLWDQFGAVGGISRGEFDRYFEGMDAGSVLILSEATALKEPVHADQFMDEAAPPQSFMYIPAQVFSQIAGAVG